MSNTPQIGQTIQTEYIGKIETVKVVEIVTVANEDLYITVNENNEKSITRDQYIIK